MSIILGPLYAQCDSIGNKVSTFNDSILELKFEKYDKQAYSTIKSELGALVQEVKSSDCREQIKDSLLINLYNYFSENVVKINGDLMGYRSYWDKINLICDRRLKTVDSTKTGIIDYYTSMKSYYESNQYWLENNYADLVIIMDNSGIVTSKMGVIKNELNNEPIKIHIQPPASIRDDYDKVRRLKYISSEFELDFSTYDPKIGFIKKITDLPVPDPDNENVLSEEIFESFALTFDDSTRYRVELNEAGQFDTLRIKPEKYWVLYNEVPDDIVVIDMPNNLEYQVIDSKSSLPKKISKNDYDNQVYIRNGIDENVEIVFQKRTRVWTHVVMRSIAVTVFLIAPLFLLGG